jgi:hypothetical protein
MRRDATTSMGVPMSQASFQKRMREKAREDKRRAKRERKEERAAQAEEEAAAANDAPVASQPAVLEQLAELHQRFDDDAIDFDEFEERKQELLAKLDV